MTASPNQLQWQRPQLSPAESAEVWEEGPGPLGEWGRAPGTMSEDEEVQVRMGVPLGGRLTPALEASAPRRAYTQAGGGLLRAPCGLHLGENLG